MQISHSVQVFVNGIVWVDLTRVMQGSRITAEELSGQRPFGRFHHLRQVMGIYNFHVSNAQAFYDFFDFGFWRIIARRRFSYAGMRLVPGHSGSSLSG